MVAWMSFMVRYVTAFGRDRGGDDWPRPPAPAPVDRAKMKLGRRSAIGERLFRLPAGKLE